MGDNVSCAQNGELLKKIKKGGPRRAFSAGAEEMKIKILGNEVELQKWELLILALSGFGLLAPASLAGILAGLETRLRGAGSAVAGWLFDPRPNPTGPADPSRWHELTEALNALRSVSFWVYALSMGVGIVAYTLIPLIPYGGWFSAFLLTILAMIPWLGFMWGGLWFLLPGVAAAGKAVGSVTPPAVKQQFDAGGGMSEAVKIFTDGLKKSIIPVSAGWLMLAIIGFVFSAPVLPVSATGLGLGARIVFLVILALGVCLYLLGYKITKIVAWVILLGIILVIVGSRTWWAPPTEREKAVMAAEMSKMEQESALIRGDSLFQTPAGQITVRSGRWSSHPLFNRWLVTGLFLSVIVLMLWRIFKPTKWYWRLPLGLVLAVGFLFLIFGALAAWAQWPSPTTSSAAPQFAGEKMETTTAPTQPAVVNKYAKAYLPYGTPWWKLIKVSDTDSSYLLFETLEPGVEMLVEESIASLPVGTQLLCRTSRLAPFWRENGGRYIEQLLAAGEELGVIKVVTTPPDGVVTTGLALEVRLRRNPSVSGFVQLVDTDYREKQLLPPIVRVRMRSDPGVVGYLCLFDISTSPDPWGYRQKLSRWERLAGWVADKKLSAIPTLPYTPPARNNSSAAPANPGGGGLGGQTGARPTGQKTFTVTTPDGKEITVTRGVWADTGYLVDLGKDEESPNFILSGKGLVSTALGGSAVGVKPKLIDAGGTFTGINRGPRQSGAVWVKVE